MYLYSSLWRGISTWLYSYGIAISIIFNLCRRGPLCSYSIHPQNFVVKWLHYMLIAITSWMYVYTVVCLVSYSYVYHIYIGSGPGWCKCCKTLQLYCNISQHHSSHFRNNNHSYCNSCQSIFLADIFILTYSFIVYRYITIGS